GGGLAGRSFDFAGQLNDLPPQGGRETIAGFRQPAQGGQDPFDSALSFGE
ncbi:MAG: hypothetical protein QOJ16_4831, partial [Acidobacteriota bacterium]|nr:hypothetical protein [Acidobacteriota bacterium]